MNKHQRLHLKPKLISAFFKALISIGVVCLVWGIVTLKGQTADYDSNILMSSIPVMNQDIRKRLPALIDDQSSLEPKVSIAQPELYHTFPKVGEIIGTLSFPKLNRTVTIIQGSGTPQLNKGAGHYVQSALPGEIENSVISGHRETSFRNIGTLVIGDMVVAKTSAGTFTYRIIETRIVKADDRTVIVSKDVATLTLTTCYPFDTPGYSPERYIVSAILVDSVLT
jgi:LPXTG-site transpeptidase (sortase) family protein